MLNWLDVGANKKHAQEMKEREKIKREGRAAQAQFYKEQDELKRGIVSRPQKTETQSLEDFAKENRIIKN